MPMRRYGNQDAEEVHDVVCKEEPDEAQPSVGHEPVYTLRFCSPEILLSEFKLREIYVLTLKTITPYALDIKCLRKFIENILTRQFLELFGVCVY